MKPASLLTGAAVVAALLAMTFAGIEVRSVHQLQRAVSALATRRERLRAEAHLQSVRLGSSARPGASGRWQIPGQNDASVGGGLPPVAGFLPESFRAILAAHPDLARRYLNAFRQQIPATWGMLFDVLHLSPDKIAALTDLLEQREQNEITVQGAAAARGLDESAPEIQALDDRLDAGNKAAIKALLGPADYRTFHAYLHDQDVVPLVAELAENSLGTGEPLTSAQGMSLVQILAAASQRTDSGKVIENTVAWNQAAPKIAAVLTAGQMQTWSLIAQRSQSEQQARQLMRPYSSP